MRAQANCSSRESIGVSAGKSYLNFWADFSLYQLCTLRGRTDCVEPEA
jgi:hypothetical protein